MEALDQLETKELTEIFIKTAKLLIKEDIDEISRELTNVHVNRDGRKYDLRISISAIDVTDV